MNPSVVTNWQEPAYLQFSYTITTKSGEVTEHVTAHHSFNNVDDALSYATDWSKTDRNGSHLAYTLLTLSIKVDGTYFTLMAWSF